MNMNTFLFFLALLTMVGWAGAAILVIQGTRQIHFLKNVEPSVDAACPHLSVIIPARNEERNIAQALQSILHQDYPKLELVVVNDRSTDRTSTILDRMAASDSRLRIIELFTLPEGWLGKNYALHRGAKEAKGEFLLFTDADVVMDSLTLRKAMGYVHKRKLDHLTVVPGDTMPGYFLRVLAATFGFFMILLFQPWNMRKPNSHHYMGVGAFNLVRTLVYQGANGHQAIAMRPDDDMKLGKLLKKHRARQDILIGTDMISVEWYASVTELIEGLMKNMFAGFEYHVSLVILGTMASLLFHVWPFLGVFVTTGLTQLLNGLTILFIVSAFWYAMRHYGIKPWHGLLFPITVSLFLYIQWRSMLITLQSGGIIWRGTHYPLTELKANKV